MSVTGLDLVIISRKFKRIFHFLFDDSTLCYTFENPYENLKNANGFKTITGFTIVDAMKKYPLLIFSIIHIIIIKADEDSSRSSDDLPTVDYVDLEKFSGVWYEIARLPNWEQEGCLCTISTYTLYTDESINVLHECIKGGTDGRLITSTGKGWPLDETNSRLRFEYKWPMTTLNYIIEMGKHYEWVLVGHPNRKKLWIFSRCPGIDEKIFKKLVDKALELDFPVHKLTRTYHGKKCIYFDESESSI